MKKLFAELRVVLLQAGVGPRRVQRYVRELEEHAEDLISAGQHAGLDRAAAERAAAERLGNADQLANAMLAQRSLRSWSRRAPWAMFGVAPVALLGLAYFVACFILWSGWKFFLPGTATPFVPVRGFAMVYFNCGRLLYYAAPFLACWVTVIFAARAGMKWMWPAVGIAAVACASASLRVHAANGGVDMVSAVDSSVSSIVDALLRVAIILVVAGAGLCVALWSNSRAVA